MLIKHSGGEARNIYGDILTKDNYWKLWLNRNLTIQNVD